MNDRFKFRLWDKENKTYYASPYGSFALSDSGELFWIESNCDCSELNTEDYVIEQCTGLKAKDGRLIYEGDIVEFYSMSLLDALSDRHLERRVGRVVWNSETIKIDVMVGEKEVPDLCKKTDDGQFVVIGNIHENTELLK